MIGVRAVAVKQWGGRDRMELIDVEPPPVAPDGVLVRVRAAGLNPVDYKVREGYLADKFPHHFPVVLGWDVAGEVEAVGPAVEITRAPRSTAIWIARCPTPPAPPGTKNVSPPRRPQRSIAWWAVSAASGSAPASSKVSSRGMWAK